MKVEIVESSAGDNTPVLKYPYVAKYGVSGYVVVTSHKEGFYLKYNTDTAGIGERLVEGFAWSSLTPLAKGESVVISLENTHESKS